MKKNLFNIKTIVYTVSDYPTKSELDKQTDFITELNKNTKRVIIRTDLASEDLKPLAALNLLNIYNVSHNHICLGDIDSYHVSEKLSKNDQVKEKIKTLNDISKELGIENDATLVKAKTTTTSYADMIKGVHNKTENFTHIKNSLNLHNLSDVLDVLTYEYGSNIPTEYIHLLSVPESKVDEGLSDYVDYVNSTIAATCIRFLLKHSNLDSNTDIISKIDINKEVLKDKNTTKMYVLETITKLLKNSTTTSLNQKIHYIISEILELGLITNEDILILNGNNEKLKLDPVNILEEISGADDFGFNLLILVVNSLVKNKKINILNSDGSTNSMLTEELLDTITSVEELLTLF